MELHLFKNNQHQIEMMRILLLVFAIMLAGCSSSEDYSQTQEVDVRLVAHPFVTHVEAFQLQLSTFNREVVSNGKLRARRQAAVSLPFAEVVLSVSVVNGQRVSAGQVLARLCTRQLEARLAQARLSVAEAEVRLKDLLLGQGYSLADSISMPAETWRLASVQSGFARARNEVGFILADIARSTIKAPFAGVVANLEAKPHEVANLGRPLCSIIDNSSFVVDFPVMENELPIASVGCTVSVSPFANPQLSFSGRVSEVNPVVDEHGRVQLTATLTGHRDMIDGMNGNVLISSTVPNQMVVPRQAVVYRDNLTVLFKYVAGKAEWTYVNIIDQNSTHLSVVANPDRVASLAPGDTVIVAGNMNLSHGALVKIK